MKIGQKLVLAFVAITPFLLGGTSVTEANINTIISAGSWKKFPRESWN